MAIIALPARSPRPTHYQVGSTTGYLGHYLINTPTGYKFQAPYSQSWYVLVLLIYQGHTACCPTCS